MAGVLVLLVAAVCVRLGFWQIHRLQQRRAYVAEVRSGLRRAPLQVSAATAPALRRSPDQAAFQPAVVAGQYLAGRSFVYRARALRNQPCVHLFTPLRTADGTTILVDRGWIGSPDAMNLDSIPVPAGPQQVRGVLLPLADLGGDARRVPLRSPAGVASYGRLDRETLLRAHAPDALPVYLQRVAGSAGDPAPTPVPPPELGLRNHLSYAVQWFSFAAIAVIGYLALAFRRRDAHNSVGAGDLHA